MSKERQSSYFLRTQSTILNGEKQNNFNSFREQIIISKKASNRKYLSSGSNNKKNRRYISKNQTTSKQNKKKSYIGIDLQKVSGATHLYNNNKSNNKFNKNKIPKGNSLNYYKYLSKKNKPTKEEEKNINETNINNIRKSNNYSPFHNIITKIKDKNNTNNVIRRNNDNLDDINKYLIKTNSSKDNYYNKENIQYFSNNDENNIDKEETNEINNNLNYTKTYNFTSNNNYIKPNDTRLTYTYNKYNNKITNNKNLYLNNNIIKTDLINNNDCLVDKIKNITKTNPYNNNIGNNKFKNQNTNIKINKSYYLTNYNYNINDPNSGYTPLPYKSFLKSIFDQNYTNKFIKDFNAFSSSRKLEKNKFEYDKSNENNLKKMLEGVPRHLKQKNKSEIYFLNDNNNMNNDYSSKNRRSNFYNLNKISKSNNKKNNFELINNIMPPNKLKDDEKEN